MSRDDGFPIADVDTGYLDDPKVRTLWRILGDQGQMTHALVLHTATMLASWGSGCRVTVTEAAPLWLTPDPELIAALQEAKLLDASGRVPVRSWKGWHDPASKRRAASRARWERANEKRRKSADDVAAQSPRGSRDVTRATVPTVPSVPSDRTVLPARPRAREDHGFETVRETAAALGFAKP